MLTLEYLAELTLAILSHQRAKNPAAGYRHRLPRPLVDRLVPILPRSRPGCASSPMRGGLEPAWPAPLPAGRSSIRAGWAISGSARVSGDDVLERIPRLACFWHFAGQHGNGPADLGGRRAAVAANVYLGASPSPTRSERLPDRGDGPGRRRLADARSRRPPIWMDRGPTGTCWPARSTAGHLIECGAQVTGGLWHGLGAAARSCRHRLPDCRGRRRRVFRDHQA